MQQRWNQLQVRCDNCSERNSEATSTASSVFYATIKYLPILDAAIANLNAAFLLLPLANRSHYHLTATPSKPSSIIDSDGPSTILLLLQPNSFKTTTLAINVHTFLLLKRHCSDQTSNQAKKCRIGHPFTLQFNLISSYSLIWFTVSAYPQVPFPACLSVCLPSYHVILLLVLLI